MDSNSNADSRAVRARGLHYRYPDGTSGLTSVDWEVGAGERWGMIGANGSGKSTLLQHLAGVHPADGHLWIFGREARKRELPAIRRDVGFLFQDPEDQLFLPTVGEDVAFGPRNAGFAEGEVAARVSSALQRLEIEHLRDRPTHRLSGGEKQSAAIASVLALEPRLLILDEPTNDLDPSARRRLERFLAGWTGTLIVATHDLEFLLGTVSQIAILDGGACAEVGAARDLLVGEERLARYGLEEPPSLRALRKAQVNPRLAFPSEDPDPRGKSSPSIDSTPDEP